MSLDLLQFCETDEQKKVVQAVIEHGGFRQAERYFSEIGEPKHNTAILRMYRRVERRAEVKGYSPKHDMVHPVPNSFLVKGVSTYYNKEGKPSGQWVKSRLDDEIRDVLFREAIEALKETIPPIQVLPAPLDYQSDIIPFINIGDAHLGLLSHYVEVGENFDLKIAETELCGAISILIDELPACERLVINDLGDFTHYENFTATTEASGHALDYDSRFPKMIRAYSRIMRFIIEKTLTKAQNVDVIINQGNHSRTNDIWMAELLRVAYRDTGRVNVLDNDSVFIAYRMGKTLVMTHHSDKCKPARLADVMVTDFKKDYGETDFHYIDVGHVHHASVMKEYPSIIIESFNHLASLDRYAHDNGWRNRKSITMILRSKTYGEVGRRLLPIEQIRDKLYGIGHNIKTDKPVYSV